MFFETTITLPVARIKALISLIEKIQVQAKEKGIDDITILNYRLTEDMFPFSKQIQIASDNAKWMASRLTEKENPKYEDNESTLDELKTRLQKTIDFLETFSESDFANAATAEARFSWFPGMHMIGAGYILTYGLPNFFFHVVTAYNILRHHGFEIGKADFMGGELALIPDAQ
jgi:hypothetical protein